MVAKASLNSNKSIYFKSSLAFYNAFSPDKEGAIQKSTGSTSASPYPAILAKGFNPSCFIFYSLIIIIAQAPSFILEAFAAVITPSFLNTVLREENLSGLYLPNSSS